MFPLKDNVATTGAPVLTFALMAICFLTFCWQLTLSEAEGSAGDRNGEIVVGELSERDEFAAKYGTSPERLAGGTSEVELGGRAPAPLSPFTAIPVAGDFLHLIVNLLFLLIFGRTLEARVGRIRFTGIVLVAAAGSIGVQALVDPGSEGLVVGASAALAGVMGSYAVLYPRAAVLTLSLIPGFGTLLEVPAPLIIGAWLAIGLIPAVGPMLDTDLLLGTGLEYLGYAVALMLGAVLARLLSRGRPADDATLAPV